MIKNFETVSAKMRDAMEQERLAEAILDTLIENGGKMRAMEIEDVIGEWTCQRITAMLRKLVVLGLVQRVEVEGEPFELKYPCSGEKRYTQTIIPKIAYFETIK